MEMLFCLQNLDFALCFQAAFVFYSQFINGLRSTRHALRPVLLKREANR